LEAKAMVAMGGAEDEELERLRRKKLEKMLGEAEEKGVKS